MWRYRGLIKGSAWNGSATGPQDSNHPTQLSALRHDEHALRGALPCRVCARDVLAALAGSCWQVGRVSWLAGCGASPGFSKLHKVTTHKEVLKRMRLDFVQAAQAVQSVQMPHTVYWFLSSESLSTLKIILYCRTRRELLRHLSRCWRQFYSKGCGVYPVIFLLLQLYKTSSFFSSWSAESKESLTYCKSVKTPSLCISSVYIYIYAHASFITLL